MWIVINASDHPYKRLNLDYVALLYPWERETGGVWDVKTEGGATAAHGLTIEEGFVSEDAAMAYIEDLLPGQGI